MLQLSTPSHPIPPNPIPSCPVPPRPIPSQGDTAVGVSRLGPTSRVSHSPGTLQPRPSLSPKVRRCSGAAQPCAHSTIPAASFCTHVRVTAWFSLGSQSNTSCAGSGRKHEIFGGEKCLANGRRWDSACCIHRKQREKEDSLIKSG